MRWRFCICCREVNTSGHIHSAVEECQNVSGSFLLYLDILTINIHSSAFIQARALTVHINTERLGTILHLFNSKRSINPVLLMWKHGLFSPLEDWSVLSYSRWVECLSLQFPCGVDIVFRYQRLKRGRLFLCYLHTVQRSDNLNVALCGGSETR